MSKSKVPAVKMSYQHNSLTPPNNRKSDLWPIRLLYHFCCWCFRNGAMYGRTYFQQKNAFRCACGKAWKTFRVICAATLWRLFVASMQLRGKLAQFVVVKKKRERRMDQVRTVLIAADASEVAGRGRWQTILRLTSFPLMGHGCRPSVF